MPIAAEVLPGDLYRDSDGPAGVRWLVLRQHREDDALFLCLIGDCLFGPGSRDLATSDRGPFGTATGGLVFRCSLMAWIHAEDITTRLRRTGRLEPWWMALTPEK